MVELSFEQHGESLCLCSESQLDPATAGRDEEGCAGRGKCVAKVWMAEMEQRVKETQSPDLLEHKVPGRGCQRMRLEPP